MINFPIIKSGYLERSMTMINTHINSAALEEIMQLAKRKAASAAATESSSSDSADDDILSPRVREFLDRLEESHLELLAPDEEAEEKELKIKSTSKCAPEYANMIMYVRFTDTGEVEYWFNNGTGCTYMLNEKILSDTSNGDLYYAAQVARVHSKYINFALEIIRDRTHERKRSRSHEDREF